MSKASYVCAPLVSLDRLGREWYWTDRTQMSFWESLILASAEEATVINPFQHTPDEFLA